MFRKLGHSDLVFVSNFDIRISNFPISPPSMLMRIVKSYLPSPLGGEGFHCFSVCYRAVFHRTFDNIC